MRSRITTRWWKPWCVSTQGTTGTRRMNFSCLRDVTVVSFLAPCFAHQRFTMLSAYSRGLFSVVLRFDLVFWYLLNHSSSFRRSWWFMAPTGCLQCGNRWVWEDSRGPHWNTDSIQLADGPDLFPTVKNNLWCGARPVACTRPKSKRTQACTLGCTSSADIWRACSANPRKNKNHQQVCSSPANGRADARRPVGGRASLSCFLGRKRASLSHRWLWSWPLCSGLGRTEQQEGDALKPRS